MRESGRSTGSSRISRKENNSEITRQSASLRLPAGRLVSKILDLWADLTGVVLDYALKTPPGAGWLLCYGQALAAGVPATARLRQKLIDDGKPYGADAGGNPLLPDTRGRTTAGVDNMGGTAAGRLAGSPASTLGGVLGAQMRTISIAQMPSHGHGLSDPGHAHGVYDPSHTHSQSPSGPTLSTITPQPGSYIVGAANSGNVSYSGTGIGIYGAATGMSVQSAGSGESLDVSQPTIAMNKIIKL